MYSTDLGRYIANKLQHETNFGGKRLRVTQKDSETGGARNRPAPRARPEQAHSFSPTVHTVEQPQSPMSQASPAYGGPQFGYTNAYPHWYGYTQSPVFADPHSAYWAMVNAYYASSPGYMGRTAGAGDVAGAPVSPISPVSPTTPYPYYGAPPSYVLTPGMDQYHQANMAYINSTYSPIAVNNNGPEQRSSTPTPAGHGVVDESPLDSQ
jgi:hypothetical protein